MDQSGVSVLAVDGDVDMTTVDKYSAAAKRLLEAEGVQVVVIDLAGVEFIDSQGIGFLIEARNIGIRVGVEVRLRAVPARVMKVLQITGLEPIFTIDA